MTEIEDQPAEPTSVEKCEGIYKLWNTRIVEALKREKTFRTNAKKCVELYEASKPEKTPFAILYSNTETLAPAVYNSLPIPIVDRRFKDADPVGKMAAEAATRILKYLIEVESEDYDDFDELMQPAVLDGLITNRGLTRYKYMADTSNGQVSNECVYGEAVRWDKFFHGYARTWKKVPWIGFEWDMDKGELNTNFPELATRIQLTSPGDKESSEGEVNTDETREQLTGVELAKVYEIWDKTSRKVYFFSPGYKDGPLKIVDDPLGLASFFPVPKPLNFMRKVSTLVPTPLYTQYESQAKELNDITVRLKHLIRALKVRGFYNSTIEGIEKVLSAEDNVMIPVENVASMPEGMAMDKLLWLMPLADLSTTVQNLYQQREQVKQVIYEITGISDILRGASVASETATAQNIKNQWGTLRLKKMQKEVQRYTRDGLRIMLEIAVTKFAVATVSAMTGLPYPTDSEKQEAEIAAKQIQTQAQNQLPSPGQPPQPPQIPPQIQQVLQTPSWETVMGLLQNDTLRSYRVDIETNSTIDAEASQDKQDIAELLNAISQFLNGVAPLIESGTMPFDVAKGMLLAITRRFTFGPQLEDSINQMQAPQPKGPDPADQVKLQAVQAKAQADQAKSQADMQKSQQDMQIAAAEFEQKKELIMLEAQMKRMEMQLKVQELEIQRESLGMKSEANRQQHSLKLETMAAQAKAKKETASATV